MAGWGAETLLVKYWLFLWNYTRKFIYLFKTKTLQFLLRPSRLRTQVSVDLVVPLFFKVSRLVGEFGDRRKKNLKSRKSFLKKKERRKKRRRRIQCTTQRLLQITFLRTVLRW